MKTVLLACVVAAQNLFAEHSYYRNRAFRKNLRTSIRITEGDIQRSLRKLKKVPAAYWMDTKAVVRKLPNELQQAKGDLVVIVVYNLPNRDCAAASSAGEICCSYGPDGICNYGETPSCDDGLAEYENDYIDVMRDILADYPEVPVALVIEPDSLPNLVTNQAHPVCGASETQAAYMTGIKYAVETLATLDNVAIYLDAAHEGWLGWDGNADGFMNLVSQMDIWPLLRGFTINVANYFSEGIPCPDAVTCPLGPGATSTEPCCVDACGLLAQYNRANNEHQYAKVLREFAEAAMPGFEPHFVIDTSRNGNPEARSDCSAWCNARGALLGTVPTSDTLDPDLVDAYFYIKIPGESDGCTELLPSEEDEFQAAGLCPRFDENCASEHSIGSQAGEPFAPEAGDWFHYQITMLAEGFSL
ncbi:hypothetical protein CTAYLR_008460 [Chrysophaeum taylorii]|uniref:Glucanase n=1 Tax=Chrysophaeum taylorii TaxID=2483200 RepID=A0AAD7UBN7_9STRA|nr:hypothetical protein CTAYLR_008460 [Chrysophaeum taylorii]